MIGLFKIDFQLEFVKMNSLDIVGGIFLSYFAKEDVSDTREITTFDRDNYYYFNQNFRPFQRMLTFLLCFPFWLILVFLYLELEIYLLEYF
jgi:hypothetical protein